MARGVYNNPPHDGSQPGILRVSVSQPQDFAKYEVLCFMMHESVPGHHFQVRRHLAVAAKLCMKDFTKNPKDK